MFVPSWGWLFAMLLVLSRAATDELAAVSYAEYERYCAEFGKEPDDARFERFAAKSQTCDVVLLACSL